MNFYELNNSIMLRGEDGFLQLENDKLAIAKYLEFINENMMKFDSVMDRINYLINPKTAAPYYDEKVLFKYQPWQIIELHKLAYSYNFEFKTFMQAFKFYDDYALKTDDTKTFLETFEEHNCIVAMFLADGNFEKAKEYVCALMEQRVQPATPTYLNAGRARRGEMVSCFLLAMDDSTESIQYNLTNMANLSRIGGGVAFDVSNLRAFRDPIKGVKKAAKGPLHVLLIAERIFGFYDQLGQRPGSGAGYINIFHLDVNMVLDSKKENADDATRLKTLSLGLTIPQKFYDIAKENEDFYGFSPYNIQKYYGLRFTEVDFDDMYDVFMADHRIRKEKIMNARAFLNKIAQIQLESGYPYIFNITNANKQHALKNEGRITMSNLCTEIMQLQEVSEIGTYFQPDNIKRDISCNLDSINITNTMESKDIKGTVFTAMDVVTAVSNYTNIDTVPSVAKANDDMHSVGVGAMDLNGFLAKNHISYESFEARDFARTFFMMMNFYSLERSCEIAQQTGINFKGFYGSDYDTGIYFDKYLDRDYSPKSEKVKTLFEGIHIPTISDWDLLKSKVRLYGLYHAYRLTIAPTQSISYVQNATSSVMPVVDVVEIRSYKKGKIFYPAPHYRKENMWFYKSAYNINMYKLIDLIAIIQEHVDQGISCILYVNSDISTAELGSYYIYANNKNLKSLYYTRTNRKGVKAPVGDTVECVACSV